MSNIYLYSNHHAVRDLSYDLLASFLSLLMNFPERSAVSLDYPLNIFSNLTSLLSKQSITLISHELSLNYCINTCE